MFAALSVIILVLPFSFATSRGGLVAVRQDSGRVAHVQTMSAESGDITTESNLTFPFSWPYVQMTADVRSETTYLTAFPDGFSYPVLYVLNHDLEVTDSFVNADFTWWDLQAAPRQDTLYGIMVTEDFNGGMYGRTISNYTRIVAADGSLRLQPQQLYTLPYMWYVNASSVDQVTSTYFALVNNFPGHENSTTDQKLVIGVFSEQMATSDPTDEEKAVTVLDLSLDDVMAQFIAFSGRSNELFFSGPSKTSGATAITVGVLCREHGKIKRVLYQSKGISLVGPLVADEAQARLLFFAQSESDLTWRLMSVGYEEGSEAVVVAVYSNDAYLSVGAAVHMLI